MGIGSGRAYTRRAGTHKTNAQSMQLPLENTNLVATPFSESMTDRPSDCLEVGRLVPDSVGRGEPTRLQSVNSILKRGLRWYFEQVGKSTQPMVGYGFFSF